MQSKLLTFPYCNFDNRDLRLTNIWNQLKVLGFYSTIEDSVVDCIQNVLVGITFQAYILEEITVLNTL